MAIVAIIPARYGSTRLPGKPLSNIQGKPMIQWVYERVRRARRPERVLVATEDERVAAVVRGFGGEVRLTSPGHASGTDRIAEAVHGLSATIVVNVQGDEPLVNPTHIDAAIEPLLEDPSLPMATLAALIEDAREIWSPTVVKVVSDVCGNALYFTRGAIPYVRLDGAADSDKMAAEAVRRGLAYKHIGLYVYRRETLEQIAALPTSPLEQAEGLEQLRALHHGIRIRVITVEQPAPAVDTQEDLERVRALAAREVLNA